MVAAGAVLAIVALPAGLMTHTKIPVALWILRRPSEYPDPVLLVDASRLGVDVVSRAVEVSTILTDDDATLMPERWVGDAPSDGDGVARELTAALDVLTKTVHDLGPESALVPPPLRLANVPTHTVAELQRIGAITEVTRGTMRPGTGGALPEDVVKPVHVRDGLPAPLMGPALEGVAERELTRPGAVLVTTTHGINAVVDTVGGHRVSQQVTVMYAHEDAFEPEFLARAVTAEWNDRFLSGAGIMHARIKDLQVPMPSRQAQRELVSSIVAAERVAVQAESVIAAASQISKSLLAAARYRVNLDAKTPEVL